MDHEERYVQDTTTYDEMLTSRGFTRICDYARRITEEDVIALDAQLSVTEKERPMQNFLASRPHLVVNTEMAHGCRWIKSEPSLGNERHPDFMIARRDSSGLQWTLIELQDPMTKLFLDDGLMGGELREAIQQIGQWREWINHWGLNLMANFGYPRLSNHFRAVIIIGRSADKINDLHGNDQIAALERQHRVEIRSYDHITRAAWEVLHDCGIDHS